MTSKDHEKIYDPLMEGTDVPADGDFSLEEILAEYGTSREQQILRDVERTVSAKTQAVSYTHLEALSPGVGGGIGVLHGGRVPALDDGHHPVSYTHLDVYKRQTMRPGD